MPAARAQATIEAAPTKYEATDAAEPEVPQVTYVSVLSVSYGNIFRLLF